MPTKTEIDQAYQWAINQNHSSVAARYAKILAECLRDTTAELNRRTHELCLLAEKKQKTIDQIKSICFNNDIMESTVVKPNSPYKKSLYMVFRIIAYKIMDIIETEGK